MVPGPPFLSLTMAWAADYDPSKPMTSDTPQSQADGSPTFSGHDGDSDSELVKNPFDLCLARLVLNPMDSVLEQSDDSLACDELSCTGMYACDPQVVWSRGQVYSACPS